MRKLLAFLAGLLLCSYLLTGQVIASDNTSASYWQTQYPGSDCFSHGLEISDHGAVVENTVQLAPWNPGWTAYTGYKALIIFSATTPAIYEWPTSGTGYVATGANPITGWVVCKQRADAVTTTSTVVVTTLPDAPTSTIGTIDGPGTVPVLTTLPAPATTTTVPLIVVTPVPSTTQPIPTTTVVPQLPRTGSSTDWILMFALIILIIGYTLWGWSKKHSSKP